MKEGGRAEAGAPISCPSCDAPRVGRYCAACGERYLTVHDLELKHYLLEHLPHELFHVDGKLLATLRLLIARPGELAADYSAGRRRPYFDPLRLYVVVFIVHAFLAALGEHHATLPEQAERIDPTGLVTALAAHRQDIDWADPLLARRLEARQHWVGEFGTMLIVFLVAAVQFLVFQRFRRRYLEHLALTLSVTTFFLCFLSVADLAGMAIGRGRISVDAATLRDQVASIALFVYWAAAIHRFYGTGIPATLGFAVVMTAVDGAIGLMLNMAILSLMILGA